MIDVDFECSIPNTLIFVAEEEELGHLLNVTKKYAKNSKTWRAFLNDLYDVDESTAKRMPYSCMFGGMPIDGNPLLWTIKREIFQFSETLFSRPAYQHLLHEFAEKPNPQASRLAKALLGKEDMLLEDYL